MPVTERIVPNYVSGRPQVNGVEVALVDELGEGGSSNVAEFVLAEDITIFELDPEPVLQFEFTPTKTTARIKIMVGLSSGGMSWKPVFLYYGQVASGTRLYDKEYAPIANVSVRDVGNVTWQGFGSISSEVLLTGLTIGQVVVCELHVGITGASGRNTLLPSSDAIGDIAITPDGTKGFMSLWNSGAVLCFHPEQPYTEIVGLDQGIDEWGAPIDSGGGPFGLKATNENLVVANFLSATGQVAIFDLTKDDIAFARSVNLPAGANARHVAVSPGDVVTVRSNAAAGATSLPVNAIPEILPVGTIVSFGGIKATLTAQAAAGATTLTVSALPYALWVDMIGTYEGVYAWVTDEQGRVHKITIKTGAITSITISAGKSLRGIAVSSVGSYVLVGNWTDGTVHRINVSSGAVATTTGIPGGSKPCAIELAEESNKLWVLLEGTNRLVSVHASSNAVVDDHPLLYNAAAGTPRSLAVSKKGRYAWVVYNNGLVAQQYIAPSPFEGEARLAHSGNTTQDGNGVHYFGDMQSVMVDLYDQIWVTQNTIDGIWKWPGGSVNIRPSFGSYFAEYARALVEY